jgi:hypothetical protein
VLNLIAKGVGQRAIAVQFGVAKSTKGNIDKNRGAILNAWEENCDSERKRKLRKTDNTAVNIITLQFFLNVAQWISHLPDQCFKVKQMKTPRGFTFKTFKQAKDGLSRSEHVITLTSDLSQVSRQEWTWKQLNTGSQNLTRL